MIASSIDSGALNGDHIEVILDDTEDMGVPPGITADPTEWMVSISHSKALGALGHIFMKFPEYLRKVFYIGRICLEQKKRELCRGFLPDSGKEIDHIDESFERFGQR